MLKIRINNEEVVSNKDFTINEEMLNTSSVILNNVYPKTWEEDKDYISRFYHPNDYSKCMISDETDVPEEPGITVEDTSFSINVDTTKEYEFTSYKGQTTQSGTPTPTAPQPINVVSGRQDVVVCGKNLLDYHYSNLNNITRSTASEETNGFKLTSTGVSGYGYGALTLDNSLLGQTITISMTSSGNKTPSGRLFYVRDNGTIGTNVGSFWTTNNSHTTTLPSTIPSGSKAIALVLYISQGNNASGDYAIFKNIQVEKGSTATEYEAYKGNTYEINLGKNLAYMKNGTYTFQNNTGVISDNILTLNSGSAGSNTYISLANGYAQQWAPTSNISGINDMNLTSNGGDYVASIYTNKTYSGTVQFYVFTSSGRNFVKRFDSATNTTLSFTLNDDEHVKDIGVWTNSTNVFEDYQIRVQLEKGSEATSYAEYKTPIELCKIGNYQDRIFKSSGKNLCSGTELGAYNSSGEKITGTYLVNKDIIRVEPSTNYKISNNGSGIAVNVLMYDRNGTYLRVYQFSGTQSIAIPEDTYFINFWRANNLGDNVNIQLEKGTSITSYEPYGTGWFIEKNIGKVVLNGSENISLVATGTNYARFNMTLTGVILGNSSTYTLIRSNYYYPKYAVEPGAIFISSTPNIVSLIHNSVITLADYKTWLGTAKPSIYYVLKTPTYTEITDSELIGQLEGIELLNGLNNIGISTPYLPMIMNLHYNYVIPRTDVDILFCGVVKNSGNISLNPRDPHYQTLQILSYKTFLSEGETLDFVIYQKTIKEAIEQIVGVIADYGFVVGNINLTNGDEVIGAYSTKDKTAYDVFNYLADITQSRWTTRLIDENTVAIDFYDPTLLPLGTAIDYTNECFENHTIDNMSYSYGSNDYRNKQVMTSQEVYSNISQTQSVIANGYQTQFNVEQKIGKINFIKIGATSYTIATNQEKEMGVSADFYYTPGNNYFESATTIAVGTSITVEYIPIVEGRQIISNSTEIDRIANSTGVKGVIARYENRNDAITSQELQKIGQSYIKYKGVPEIILTVQTRSNLWNIGDRVPFNAPIDELKTEYMVKAKKINYITTIDTIFYTYELTSSFNSENAINYFDNQRAKATGNIGSGEYISRNIDIQSDANIIFYDTTATEIEIVGDNTLEAVLEAPFVS